MKKLIPSSTVENSQLKYKETLSPLHRSKTEDDEYKKESSPITQFVCKLLGLSNSNTQSKKRRPTHHKSLSTTSITKTPVITSYNTVRSDLEPKRPTAITIVTPEPNILSLMKDWDQPYKKQPESVISNPSFVLTDSSSVSSLSNSAAVDALVHLSTKLTPSHEFDNMPPVTLFNRNSDTEPVLTGKIAERIRPYIPRRFRVAQNWNLLYSLDQHGISLNTLYSRSKDHDGPCILIIKDDKEQIFGAYLSNSLSPQSHFYGTGECFLWKLVSLNEEKNKKNIPKLKTFPWTGKNDYMILSDYNFIAIGGGNGQFGLWLDSNLHKGYTHHCPTFDNENLSITSEFQCLELEIWGLCL